jgi:cytochrome oxidase Cu insertion factor (SCO1/SenC/PrrC family)
MSARLVSRTTRMVRAVLALLLTGCLLPAPGEAASRYKPGDTLSEQSFRTLDGKTLNLADFRGKMLILTFLTEG